MRRRPGRPSPPARQTVPPAPSAQPQAESSCRAKNWAARAARSAPLTAAVRPAHIRRGSAGRAAAPYGPGSCGEESPGSMERRCRITSGGGDPRDSATESRPPCHRRVRVKGCGKSAPRTRQRGRHGKPHREQDRIGATCPPARDGTGRLSRPDRSGWLLEAVGDDRPRGMAATSGASSAGPYRTRLTGRLILSAPTRS